MGGWRSVLVNYALVGGLARETVGDTMSQRKRWVAGNVQHAWFDIDLGCITDKVFRWPPYQKQRRQAYKVLKLEDEAGDNLSELAPHDVGAAKRQARRRSAWLKLLYYINYACQRSAVFLYWHPL